MAQADVFGTSFLNVQLPTTPLLNGLVVYTQTIGLDAAANPFGLTASNFGAQQFVAPYSLPQPVRRVYSLSGRSATGTASILFLVTRFY